MLEARVVELAHSKALAAVATLLPDGRPMNQPHWIDADDEHLLINTEVHRQKYRNLQRDPRLTVTIVDPANPFSYVEVRGHVAETVTGPEARDHIDQLSRKYIGADYAAPIKSERVIVKIAPDRTYIR
jgi:PPOX class probable F420-dependent enzyme